MTRNNLNSKWSELEIISVISEYHHVFGDSYVSNNVRNQSEHLRGSRIQRCHLWIKVGDLFLMTMSRLDSQASVIHTFGLQYPPPTSLYLDCDLTPEDEVFYWSAIWLFYSCERTETGTFSLATKSVTKSKNIPLSSSVLFHVTFEYESSTSSSNNCFSTSTSTKLFQWDLHIFTTLCR